MQEINSIDKRFHNGNGYNEMGTIVTAEWLNAVQDELVGLIKSLGGAVDEKQNSQIATLLTAKFGNKTELADFTNLKNLLIGIPFPYPLSAVPTGCLAFNGQAFSTAMYPELAKKYPSGRLPDLRGEFIRGWDNGRGVDNARGILSNQKSTATPFDPSIVGIAICSLANKSGNGYDSISLDNVNWSDYPNVLIPYYHIGNTDTETKAMDEQMFSLTGYNSSTSNTYLTKKVASSSAQSGWGFGGVRPRNIAYQYICLAA